MSKEARRLTGKQERFCREYIVDLNATAAAKRAEFSERSAMEIGYALLKNEQVKARIKELMDERTVRTQLHADRALTELFSIALADIGSIFEPTGQLKLINEWPEAMRRAVAGFEVTEIFDGQGEQKTAIGLLKKVKLHDKGKFIDMLMKHFGEYKPAKVEHSVDKTLEQLLEESWSKGEEGKDG